MMRRRSAAAEAGQLSILEYLNHASTRTTLLYGRRHDDVSLNEVERLVI
jgi:hypothetical protein